MRMDDSFVLP